MSNSPFKTQSEAATSRADSVLPTLAIVGRPNVGKSTLFNRIIGSRRAIVGDEPGITRDRLYGTAEWNGRALRVIDTGGIVPDDPELIPAEIFRQAKVALQQADVIVMVVDLRTELAAPDIDLARLLLRMGKPLFLAVNKVDAPQLEAYAEEFRRLGIANLFPISAEHGTGVADLLDAVVALLPEKPKGESAGHQADVTEEVKPVREVKIAIIGRPNVGKSTLLNRLTGTGRAIVSPIPGTTRDAVDEIIEHEGIPLRFIDTAGIRRKGKTRLMAEKLSVVMARKHLEAADIALLVIDATEGVTALDANIAGYAHESGRSVVIVINKWDLVAAGKAAATKSRGKKTAEATPADRNLYEKQVRAALKFLGYAPVLFISAATGKNVDKVLAELLLVAEERRKRIPTAEMNRFVEHIDFERAPVPMAKRVRILYMTQAGTAPPTFVVFVDRDVKLHFSYERFLENQIRRAFGFVGTPIRIKARPRS
jgi:GTP-binding protein